MMKTVISDFVNCFGKDVESQANKDFQLCESGEPWRLPASEQGKALKVTRSAPLWQGFLALPATVELTFPGFLILL